MAYPFRGSAHNWFDNVSGTAFATYAQLVEQQNLIYTMMKTKYSAYVVTSLGFEFFMDTDDANDWAVYLLKHFLDSANGAQYDGLAIHTYPLRPDELYVFFKTFHRESYTKAIAFDGQTLPWTVNFGKVASMVSVRDMLGNLLSQHQNVESIQVEAENSPRR